MTQLNFKSDFGYSVLKKIWTMLPAQRKRDAVRLWLMMMVGMMLEMLGVGLVLPVIALLTQPEKVLAHPMFKSLLGDIGEPSQQSLVFTIMLVLVTVYLVKNLYLAFLAWRQSRFIFGMQSELSQKLFAIYLRQPYTFHLQKNSAHLIRNVQSEMGLFINGMVIPSMLILAEGLVVLGLFILLLYVEPIGTFAVFILLFLAGGIFHKFTRHHLVFWGRQRQLHEGSRVKQLQEGLGGVKDVKLLGRESDFLNQYASHTIQSMRMSQRQFTMQQIPRLWLELLAISGLAILMITMTLKGKPLVDFIPTLALFAAISFRLMPSANRIISSIQQLRFGLPVVDLLSNELNLTADNILDISTKPRKFENQLELVDISYNYPNTKKLALDNVSLTIRKGQSVGFIGESGSGKSTLVDLVLGLLVPISGKVMLDGVDISHNPRPWQDQVGYVPQSIYLTDDTLRRNVAFGIADQDIDDNAVKRAIKAAQLEKFVAGLADGLATIVGERGVRLSGGQRQRIGIARALYHDPSVLVLDEATSSLDNETEAEVMQAISALHQEKTILIVAHRLSTVKQCDKIYRFHQGSVEGVGTPDSLLNLGT